MKSEGIAECSSGGSTRQPDLQQRWVVVPRHSLHAEIRLSLCLGIAMQAGAGESGEMHTRAKSQINLPRTKRHMD